MLLLTPSMYLPSLRKMAEQSMWRKTGKVNRRSRGSLRKLQNQRASLFVHLCLPMLMPITSITFIGTRGCIAVAVKWIRMEIQTMTSVISFVFYGSVDALIWLARLLGITYQEINVLIFCIGWPLVTVIMAVAILRLWRKNHVLSRQLLEGV